MADTTAPNPPGTLSLSAVAGGVEINWVAVGGDDVAGCNINYNDSAFGE